MGKSQGLSLSSEREVSLLEYLLVEYVKQEVGVPVASSTHGGTHAEMYKRVATVLDVGVGGVTESYLGGVECFSNTYVCRGSIWTERHGQNLDRGIFTRNDASEYI